VEDFVFADDRALHAGGDADQVPHRAVTRFEVETIIDVGDGAESVELDAVAGAQQDPVGMSRHSGLQRARETIAFAGAGRAGLNRHDPWLLTRHRRLAYVFFDERFGSVS